MMSKQRKRIFGGTSTSRHGIVEAANRTERTRSPGVLFQVHYQAERLQR
jgi:hypothetical protein